MTKRKTTAKRKHPFEIHPDSPFYPANDPAMEKFLKGLNRTLDKNGSIHRTSTVGHISKVEAKFKEEREHHESQMRILENALGLIKKWRKKHGK